MKIRDIGANTIRNNFTGCGNGKHHWNSYIVVVTAEGGNDIEYRVVFYAS